MQAVGADDHRLLDDPRLLGAERLVVANEVLREARDALGVAEDHGHRAHRALALLDLLLGRPLLRAAVVVLLDLAHLIVGELHAGEAGLVRDAHRDPVVARLLHRVPVDHGAEHGDGLVDRGAGEADVGRVREAVAEVLREAVPGEHALVGPLELGADARLRAVRLVGDAHDVGPIGEQPRVLAELLDGRDVDAPGRLVRERAPQLGARLDAADFLLMQKPLRRHEKLARLAVQVLPVHDDDDRRVAEHAAAPEHH